VRVNRNFRRRIARIRKKIDKQAAKKEIRQRVKSLEKAMNDPEGDMKEAIDWAIEHHRKQKKNKLGKK